MDKNEGLKQMLYEEVFINRAVGGCCPVCN